MKTKFIFLLLICIVFSSCSEDDHKDEDDKIVLTEDNYLFEGDLYKYALNLEIDSLKIRANELQVIIDSGQGSQETKDDYTATKQNLDATIARETLVIGSDELAIRIPRNPLPVPPRPTVIPKNFKYFVTYNTTLEYLTGTNEQGKLVLKTEIGNGKILPDTEGLLVAHEATLIDAKLYDAIVLSAKRINADGSAAEYEISIAVIK